MPRQRVGTFRRGSCLCLFGLLAFDEAQRVDLVHRVVDGIEAMAVNSLLAIRPSVHSYGGVLRPLESAWVWRHQRHLDGLDPEGNVFQLREPLTPT